MRMIFAVHRLAVPMSLITLLGVCQFAGAGDTDAEVSAGLAEILEAWSQRDAQPRSGILEWRIERQNRSPTFGPFERFAAGGEAAREETGERFRVLFSERGYRLEGESCPAEGLSSLRSWLSRDPVGELNSRTRFDAALGSRFAAGADRPLMRPYVMIRNAEREIHFWKAEGKAYPFGGICRAGERGDFFSGSMSWLLIDALDVSLHITAGRPNNDLYAGPELLEQRPVIRGRRCYQLRQRRHEVSDDEERRYWVDPGPGHRLLRYDVLQGGQAWSRYDFHYDSDQDASGIPRRITLLRLYPDGGVHNEAVFVLENAEWGVELPDETLSLEFPAGALVTDFIDDKRYLVREDGRKRFVTASDVFSGRSYEDVRDGREPAIGFQTREHIGQAPPWRGLVWWITWPGMLLTLSVAGAVYFVGGVGLRHWRVVRGESVRSSQEESELS